MSDEPTNGDLTNGDPTNGDATDGDATDGDPTQDAIWAFLEDRAERDSHRPSAPGGDRDRGERDGGERDGRRRRARPSRDDTRFRRDAMVPILDAALGVLAATRHLVEVTEEVVREQRDRLAVEPQEDPDQDGRRRPTPIHLSY